MSGLESAHPWHQEHRSFVKGATKPRIEEQIPCAICFAPATSPDLGPLRECRCPTGHITLATATQITAHTKWLATNGAYNGPSAQ